MSQSSTARRRIIAWGAAVAVTVAGAGVAWAYFTDTGSGSGTAAVGTSSPFVVTGTPAVTGLQPGATASKVGFTVANTNTSGAQYVNTVSVAIRTYPGVIGVDAHAGETYGSDGTTPNDGCMASWFTVGGSPMSVASQVAGGASRTVLAADSLLTVRLDNLNLSQNACQGDTLYLDFASN